MLLQTAPVSAMTQVPARDARRNKISVVLEVIDAIHKCWLLSDDLKVRIQVANPTSLQNARIIDDYDGFYIWTHFPPDIFLSPNLTHPEFVLLHEIGHYLDHWHLDADRQFATMAGDNRMSDIETWYNVVQTTTLWKRLQACDPMGLSPEQQEERNYLLHPSELWACSYAQYIAEASSNGELHRQMDTYRVEDIFLCRQWPRSEFQPVSQAVEQILKGRGWLR